METLEHTKMAERVDNTEEPYEHVISISKSTETSQGAELSDVFGSDLETIRTFFKGDRNVQRKIDTRLEKAAVEKARTPTKPESKQVVLRQNAYSLFDLVEPPYNLATLAKLYEQSSPNYAAINAKVAHLVGLGYNFEPTAKLINEINDVKSEDQRKSRLQLVEEAQIELVDIFDAISEDRSFTDVMHRVATDLEATGVAYIEIGRTTRGQIGYICHIPSHTVRVRRAKDGYVQLADGLAVFFAPFGKANVKVPFNTDGKPNELIQLKKFTPTNTYYGVADVVAAKEAAYGLIAANGFNLDYFSNKAVPRYVVSIEGAKIDKAGEQNLIEFLTGLKNNHHRTILVPLPANPQTGIIPKMVFNKVEHDVQEGSFSKYKTQSMNEVLMAHRTPISKVGSVSSEGGGSLANSRDQDRTFKEQVIRPAQELIEARVNWIVSEFTNAFKLRFNEFTLTDEDTQSQIDERDARMGSLMPNERRRKLGLPPIDGGDEPAQISAQAKAEQTAQATGNRTRDQERSSKSPDKQGDSRSPKGEGRTTQ
jgi:PBSX family phage portal protein